MSVLPIISVVGPTGSGKSELAIELALALGGECVNADSMQFYRGMDIGTAKLAPEEMRGVPHHLLDIMDVREEASVAVFQRQARDLFGQIAARGKVPILVGGSGLYVRAALDHLEFPGTDPQVRSRIETQLAREGIGVLRDRLMKVDPLSAARVNDERRVVRALEVWEVTGRPFSSFMPVRRYVSETLQIGINGDRNQLHERLHARVVDMHRRGLLGEVERLESLGLREGKTASQAIGYRQFLRVLDSRRGVLDESYTVDWAIDDTVRATRQFARRQITWFRADPRVSWIDWSEASPAVAAVRLARDFIARVG